jgi:hypothetical protein
MRLKVADARDQTPPARRKGFLGGLRRRRDPHERQSKVTPEPYTTTNGRHRDALEAGRREKLSGALSVIGTDACDPNSAGAQERFSRRRATKPVMLPPEPNIRP